jgi:hypothetical protein
MTTSSGKATGFTIISRPTKLCGLAIVTFFIMSLVATGRVQADHNSNASNTFAGLSHGLLGLSVLAGIIMVVIDIGRIGVLSRRSSAAR